VTAPPKLVWMDTRGRGPACTPYARSAPAPSPLTSSICRRRLHSYRRDAPTRRLPEGSSRRAHRKGPYDRAACGVAHLIDPGAAGMVTSRGADFTLPAPGKPGVTSRQRRQGGQDQSVELQATIGSRLRARPPPCLTGGCAGPLLPGHHSSRS
jgi:hypothetical protein